MPPVEPIELNIFCKAFVIAKFGCFVVGNFQVEGLPARWSNQINSTVNGPRYEGWYLVYIPPLQKSFPYMVYFDCEVEEKIDAAQKYELSTRY
jgi:hypothetical protein